MARPNWWQLCRNKLCPACVTFTIHSAKLELDVRDQPMALQMLSSCAEVGVTSRLRLQCPGTACSGLLTQSLQSGFPLHVADNPKLAVLFHGRLGRRSCSEEKSQQNPPLAAACKEAQVGRAQHGRSHLGHHRRRGRASPEERGDESWPTMPQPANHSVPAFLLACPQVWQQHGQGSPGWSSDAWHADLPGLKRRHPARALEHDFICWLFFAASFFV
mmetsp:Transcript_90482/g.163222  ORF Transcript_90482/g.163222 Transcript_90482/m.163222 type:complete len:217 (+) Transcript_90482:139-789(+)